MGENEKINIVLPDRVAVTYSNFTKVTRMRSTDFHLDFAHLAPEDPSNAYITSRVIISPPHMKALAKIFQQHVERYEQQHGEISGVAQVPEVVYVSGEN